MTAPAGAGSRSGGPSHPGGPQPPLEVSELGGIDATQAAILAGYRQGDALEGVATVHVADPNGQITATDTPLGVVLISQTCDVVRPERPAAQVARRVRLDSGAAKEARDGKRPRFAHLPQLGDHDFVDLDVLATMSKAHLATLPRTPGVATDEEIRNFSGAIARKFGRFAFPDAVAPWLNPLETVVASKHRKPASPEGQALHQVTELRIEATGGWAHAPYDLTLCVIVEPGTLPTFPGDDLPDRVTEVSDWLDTGTKPRSAGEIADRLVRTTDPSSRYWLWMALGDAWAARCVPKAGEPAPVYEAVSSLQAEVVPADEFPLTRVRRSEILDLDHLSGPTPDLGSERTR